ncbi:hypothetical protein RM190_23355, partial [Paracoccus sp. CPCC 101403]
MSATWTTSSNLFSGLEQNGWKLFNQQGREIKRSTDLNQLQPVNQRYTLRLLDPVNLRVVGNPTLAYSDTTNGTIQFTAVSGKPGDYVALVENVGNRKYGNLSAYTSKVPGAVIPAITSDPLG